MTCWFKCFYPILIPAVSADQKPCSHSFSVVSLNCTYLEQVYFRGICTLLESFNFRALYTPLHPTTSQDFVFHYRAPANPIILARMNTMLYFIPTIQLHSSYTLSYYLLLGKAKPELNLEAVCGIVRATSSTITISLHWNNASSLIND